MLHCLHKSFLRGEDLQQFEELQKAFNWSDSIAETKIGTWQSINNSTDFPSMQEMKDYEKNAKKELKQNTGYTQEMISIKNQAIANGTFMKALNGKPTNLNERQWLIVRTKAFKDWFGDWINDPANASKVIDENGEPLVVYHGTTANFTEFSKEYLGKSTGAPSAKLAFFAASSRDLARRIYAKLETNEELFTRIQEIDPNSTREDLGIGPEEPSEEDFLYSEFADDVHQLQDKYADVISDAEKLRKAEEKSISTTINSAEAWVEDFDVEEYIQYYINKGYTVSERQRKEYNEGKDITIYKIAIGYEDTDINTLISKLNTKRSKEYLNDYNNLKNNLEQKLQNVVKESDKVKALFLNIRNPKTDSDYGKSYRSESYHNRIKEAIDRGKDGGVIKDTKDPLKSDIYYFLDPNQAKSATDNIEFSRIDNNMYQNIQNKLENISGKFIEEVLTELSNSPLAHRWGNRKLRITKSKANKNDIYDYLMSKGIPYEAINIDAEGATQVISIDEYKVREHLQQLTDVISRNYANQNFDNAFTSIQDANKMRNILAFLSEKTGLTYEFISYNDAKKINKNISEDTNAFVLDNKVYFIQGKTLNMDIAAEEMLHPFIASIKLSNPKAFNSLLNDAKKAYPKLRLEISVTYKNNKDEELVTQALSRAFREDRTFYPKGHPIKELIRHFIQYLKTHIFTKTSWNQIMPEEITAEMLDTNITIEELARIVNSELKVYSGYIPGLRENKYNRKETSQTDATTNTVSVDFYTKEAALEHIEDLVAYDDIKREDIVMKYTPVNEDEDADEYWTVSYKQSTNEKDAGPIPSNVIFSKNGTERWNDIQSQAAATIASEGRQAVDATIDTMNGKTNSLNEQEQKQAKTILGTNRPKVLMASEHSDPVFHAKKIIQMVQEEQKKPVKERKFHMLQLMTKHDGLPLRQLLELKIPKSVHFSITSLGGSKWEPGVMKADDLLDKIEAFIKEGLLKPQLVTIRIDPIIPGVTIPSDVRHIVERAAKMGIKTFKFSVLDSYGYTDGAGNRDRFVVSKMNELGYDWDTYFGRNANGVINFDAKKEYLEKIYSFMDKLADEFNVQFNTCGEKPVNIGITLRNINFNTGCLNVKTINTVLGVSDVANEQGHQRSGCSCYGNKVDALRYDDNCASSCVYCYAKHNSDTQFNYYNEDGTLKDNPFTRTQNSEINNQQTQPIFVEESSTGYRERTIKNAKADATIALATDFTSAGERLTKKAVKDNGKKYIPVDTNNSEITDELVNDIVNQLNEVNAKSLNIAGNGIYTLKGKYTQEQVDEYVYNLLSRIINHPNLKTKIESIRSGGQTGYDEAGIKAAMRLGIKNGILAPKGWKFRDINGTDISNEQAFKARFNMQSTQPTSQEQPAQKTSDTAPNTSQEKTEPKQDSMETSLQEQMYQTWTPIVISNRAFRIARIFQDLVTELTKKLDDNERSSSNVQDRQHVIVRKYGTGNILKRVKEEIKNTYANEEWVTDYVHSLYDESDWNSQIVQEKIKHIVTEGNRMIQFFEPLCLEAAQELKRQEGISIMTLDGEVINIEEEETIDDEENKTKHEEGWFKEAHEQSVEEQLDREITQILSNIYELDEDGNYIRFDDLEQPIPYNFNYVLATLSNIVGNCIVDSQMIPKLKEATQQFPWIQQVLDIMLGRDTDTSQIYKDLSNEDIRHKTLALQAQLYIGLHNVFVNIAEQRISAETGEVETTIINNNEGKQALLAQFEDVCYASKPIFDANGRRYKTVYNADGTFNLSVYDSIYDELYSSNLYNKLNSSKLTKEDIRLIDRAFKAFGINLGVDKIESKIIKEGVSLDDAVLDNEALGEIRRILFDNLYKHNKQQNKPLKSVTNKKYYVNIFDAFKPMYNAVAILFENTTEGYEESTALVNVNGERKKLFSRIRPNHISTIVNKLKNLSKLSEKDYQEMLKKDYLGNWWFSPKKDVIRMGLIKDLLVDSNSRKALRLKTLKSSKDISYDKEIDAQGEETRLNEFERSSRIVGNVEYRDIAVPTFSDTSESYYMSMRYFNTSDPKQTAELISRLTDVLKQEIDRIRVVEARRAINKQAREEGRPEPIAMIAGFDEFGDRFNFFPSLNKYKEQFLSQYRSLQNDVQAQEKLLRQMVVQALKEEFDFYLKQYNQWQINTMAGSNHTEKGREQIVELLTNIINSSTTYNFTPEQKAILADIKHKFANWTMTTETFNNLKSQVINILRESINNPTLVSNYEMIFNNFTLDTTNLKKLIDYFYNSFYGTTQIIEITMRDPAFLGSPDKFQKRFKQFYSPVSTCYTTHYMYDDNGNIVLQNPDTPNSLTKTTEYSLILKDDILAQAFSFENIKAAINNAVQRDYITKEMAKEILDNFKEINRSDAQCYRTLDSWEKCLNMLGKGANKRVRDAIQHLKDGTWTAADYGVVWQVFKPFVSSYMKTTSGLEEDANFGENYAQIESPVQHKNSEFLLLALYPILNGPLQENVKLKALNEFMVEHGIDKVQFESAVKVGIQAPIDLNGCTTAQEVKETLENTTKLTKDMHASEGNQQVVHSIPFRDWGISTNMPEHLLEHEKSPFGTQVLKIVMEDLAVNPHKELKIGKTTMTYSQWLSFYQAIHTQNLLEDFSKVNETLSNPRELAKYLKKQILSQNKYSKDLIKHLELDEFGNFRYPIIDPLLRSQFDALCASLLRNTVTKRKMRVGALPQVASWGFEDLQLRFQDANGNIILTQKEFEEKGSVTINGVEYTTWEEYQSYVKANCTRIAYMEVLMPPFDNNFMRNVNDMFVYKEDVKDENGNIIHRSGEFNHKLFNEKVDKKMLEALGYRVPTETKHSMVPIYIKGFLPAQNSSCVVCPAEWIAISDSDNDGDKLYTLFYESKIVRYSDTDKKIAFAKSKGFKYLSKEKREDMLKNASNWKTEDYQASEELDMLYDMLKSNIKDESTKELEDFLNEHYSGADDVKTISPISWKGDNTIQDISQNSRAARNNKLLEMMVAVLQTDDNTAEVLIPGGFPIIKKVSEKMKSLMGVTNDSCSICNPAIRTIQQVRNMAGVNLIGIYANNRSFRPLLEQTNVTVRTTYRPMINGNQSIINWSLGNTKNARGEFISDNIANFSGCSVDNAKDPRLMWLGQNEVTASISMALIHMGYTIEEVALFMNQPAIKECVRTYLLNSGKVAFKNIVHGRIQALSKRLANSRVNVDVNLSDKTLENQISRSAKGILSNLEDDATQKFVLEQLEKIIPVSNLLVRIISVTKADTQVGSVKADSAENKMMYELVESLTREVLSDKCPLLNAHTLVPRLESDSNIMQQAARIEYSPTDSEKESFIPIVAAFRYYGIDVVPKLFSNISFTFNQLVNSVHDYALRNTDRLNLSAQTLNELTNATVAYLFSSIEAFKGDRFENIKNIIDTLLEIKQFNEQNYTDSLITGNELIKDLVVIPNGTIYSKNMPVIKLSKSTKKNKRVLENYQRAWESLIVNGDRKIQLKGRTITHKELSDMLLNYCFMTNGLTPGRNSFIQCFPSSRIEAINGYTELLNRLGSLMENTLTARNIFEQYLANHPTDEVFVKVIKNEHSIKKIIDEHKVVPTIFEVGDSQLDTFTYESNGEPVPYTYISFVDSTGKRFLYRQCYITEGVLTYERMCVLGNTENGFLQEYEMGKSVTFGDENSMLSVLMANNTVITSGELANALDEMQQNAASEGIELTEEDYRKVIESLVGSNVEVTMKMDSYNPSDVDLTGMKFCVTI